MENQNQNQGLSRGSCAVALGGGAGVVTAALTAYILSCSPDGFGLSLATAAAVSLGTGAFVAAVTYVGTQLASRCAASLRQAGHPAVEGAFAAVVARAGVDARGAVPTVV